MMKIFWIILLLICLVAGVAYVGAKYFNSFNFSASPNCKYNCWENGKRIR